MSHISLKVAERWHDIFNVILFVGAFAVAVGTYGAIKMGAIKERFANERAVEGNKKAEEERLARLKIEEKLAPRTLTGAQQDKIIQKLAAFSGQQFESASYQEDQEVHRLAVTLIQTLLAAGWKGLPAREMLGLGLVIGVIVEYAPEKEEEFGAAAHALADALNTEGVLASALANAEMSDHADRIRIKVGKKP